MTTSHKKWLELSPYPERAFTLISLVLALVSLAITGTDALARTVPSWMLVFKDFSIFLVLLILMLFFFLRYRQVLKDYAVQDTAFQNQLALIRRLINEQSSFYHQVMRQTRASFYSEFGAGIYPHRFRYKNPALTEIMERSLDAVVAVVVNILKNQLSMRQIPEKVSVTVKAIVTGELAKSLCTLSEKTMASVIEEKRYIITLERDADTTALVSGREVRKAVYELTENTDFNRILSGDGEDFMENDLTGLEKSGHYHNNNPKWNKHYNASLVVPIAHRETEGSEPVIYGFLTVDSLNQGNHTLFTREETRPIMAFGADLLALIFLNLEMYDRAYGTAGTGQPAPPAYPGGRAVAPTGSAEA